MFNVIIVIIKFKPNRICVTRENVFYKDNAVEAAIYCGSTGIIKHSNIM